MNKNWRIIEIDAQEIERFSTELSVHPFIAKMLLERGITTFAEAKKFFRPTYDYVHDPFLMKDMDRAVERLGEAISNDQRVLLYGDYDVDGTTSVTAMMSFLQDKITNLEYYIPDRYKEGYGSSEEGIDYAFKQGFDLVIAMDCGIRAIEKVQLAKDRDIDFIICDHHEPGAGIPDAVAVLDPKRKDCAYPFKELSGCGVTIKLIQAYCVEYNLDDSEWKELLDLLVISIACDIVPIIDENRIFAQFGLELLNKTKRLGLVELIKKSGRSKPLNIGDIVFGIGPMINATGRLDDAKQAVHLLLTEDNSVATEYSNILNFRNERRKEIDRDMAESAREMFLSEEEWHDRKSIVLFNPDWHKGVVGIAASRMVEAFFRPTIMLTEVDGKISGSARSIPKFNLLAAIEECSEFLSNYGGHRHAAGLTIKEGQLEKFRSRFETVVNEQIEDEWLIPEIYITNEMNLGELNGSFWKILRQFAPFGPGNRKPIFVSKEVEAIGEARVLKEKHLKMTIKQGESYLFSGIGFNLAEVKPRVDGKKFSVAYTLEENTWKENTSLQLNIKDCKEEELE